MGPFETVEDQAEAELVLVAVVVTGLQHMPECELGEVGVLVSGEARQHDLRERRALLWSVERQPRSCRPAGPAPTAMTWRLDRTGGASGVDSRPVRGFSMQPSQRFRPIRPTHSWLHDGHSRMSSAWPARVLAASSASAICPQTMTEAGADDTLMTLNGAYRPPLAGLGAGLDRIGLHQVATTIRSLLGRCD
jgi:hypothetical protein